MGLRHPERTRGPRRTLVRTLPLAGFVVLALALSGCSDDTQLERAGMPHIVTKQGQGILDLWQGAWIAALATGVVVWGLILFAVIYFRRRSDDEVPVQTRYNLPVEIFYTVFPIVMVIVFFSHTVRVQNDALEMVDHPDARITVVGQKWTWTFNHHLDPDSEDGKVAFVTGDLNNDEIPTLVLPVDETVEFDLTSPDVIHDFGIPAFAMRMDVVPGRDNRFQVTPTEIGGPYAGKCYELCGAYHSRMLFQVKVVSQDDYEQYVQDLAADPAHSADHPVMGGDYAGSAYLNPDEEGDD
ncbi:MAG TPA: cytochrome c oxidase subunit II [Nocardioides sp.]|nr:cytochrome c oxidase subunit II [Nocardioides sp.]